MEDDNNYNPRQPQDQPPYEPPREPRMRQQYNPSYEQPYDDRQYADDPRYQPLPPQDRPEYDDRRYQQPQYSTQEMQRWQDDLQPEPDGSEQGNEGSGINKSTLIIVVTGAIVLIGIIVALVVVLGGNSNNSSINEPITSITSSPSPTQSPSSSSSPIVSNPSKGLVERKIDKIIEEADLGYTINVKRAVFNIPFDGDDDPVYNEPSMSGLRREDSYNSVGIEIEIENLSRYTSSFSTYDFKLMLDGQEHEKSDYAFANYIDDNRLTVLPPTVTLGKKVNGWVFFQYEITQAGTPELIYIRPALTIEDGTTFPEAREIVSLQ